MGVKMGPIRYFETICKASARSSGVKSIRSARDGIAARPYGGGLVGKGCVGEYHSPGTVPFSTGFSTIGHTGSPVTRSNTYSTAILLVTITALIFLPFTVISASTGAAAISIFHSE